MRIFLLGILICIGGCQNKSNEKLRKAPENKELAGSDSDKHNCINSARYTWSVAKDTCIRVFEEGTPLVKYDVATGVMDSSKLAYLVLSHDKKKAEVFFGITDKPDVMDALPQIEGENNASIV